MNHIKVSFVTVTYRMQDLVRLLLRGVERARFPFPFEYFVVNNAPEDETSRMIRARFPWVNVINAPGNIGFGRGNNLALERARGEFVMLLNPDLTVFPGEIEKLLAFADTHPDIGIFGPHLLHPNGMTQRTFHRFHRLFTPVYRRTKLGETSWGRRAIDWFLMAEANVEDVHLVDSLFGAALLLRRRALEEIGFFDERFFMYFEDVDLCRRAWERGWRVCYAPVARFVHYHQRESVARHWWDIVWNPLSRAHIASAAKYFLKYRGVPLPRKEG